MSRPKYGPTDWTNAQSDSCGPTPKPTTGEWTAEFAGGDALRIGGSSCSYGYSKQQAVEICVAHNAAVKEAYQKGYDDGKQAR